MRTRGVAPGPDHEFRSRIPRHLGADYSEDISHDGFKDSEHNVEAESRIDKDGPNDGFEHVA